MGQGFSKTASINGCYALNPEQRRDEDEENEKVREHKYQFQNTKSKNNGSSNVYNTVNCSQNCEDSLYSPVSTAITEVNICNSGNNSSSVKPDPQNLSSPKSLTLSKELYTTPTNSTSCPRQIIIKIQLAKMENDFQTEEQFCASSKPDSKDMSNNNRHNNLSPSNNNKYRTNPAEGQYLNVTVNEERAPSNIDFTTTTNSSTDIPPHFVMNNNFVPNVLVTTTSLPSSPKSTPQGQEELNILMSQMGALNLDERCLGMASSSGISDVSDGESTKNQNNRIYSSNLKTATSSTDVSLDNRVEEGAGNSDGDHCCRRKSKSNVLPSKWRHCKCTCRDAFKRIIDGSSPSSYSPTSNTAATKSPKKKESKDTTNGSPIKSKSPQKGQHQQQPIQRQHSNQQSSLLWTPHQMDSNSQLLQTNNYELQVGDATNSTNSNAAAHMSIWSPNKNDVIIPLSSPQFVVVQCPPSSLVTLGRIDDNAIRLMATELVPGNSPQSSSNNGSTGSSSENSATTNIRVTATTQSDLSTLPLAAATPGNTSLNALSSAATPSNFSSVSTAPATTAIGPVVHSQVDYIHCLVPDLEKIIKASFYWGKMDRYEAERLLEGKPEGTFLLRDSAQEEYLFSVTFRKYGRSLHARIEQSNHKFSFDCHDPCVFTASTVTGLLEHYKDPACVMFFEPMLTIPLHRNSTFKLQQLCRATIVSHTSYDGINELELPARLKAYLKEYHYKQKLRVKPFDEPFYTCT